MKKYLLVAFLLVGHSILAQLPPLDAIAFPGPCSNSGGCAPGQPGFEAIVEVGDKNTVALGAEVLGLAPSTGVGFADSSSPLMSSTVTLSSEEVMVLYDHGATPQGFSLYLDGLQTMDLYNTQVAQKSWGNAVMDFVIPQGYHGGDELLMGTLMLGPIAMNKAQDAAFELFDCDRTCQGGVTFAICAVQPEVGANLVAVDLDVSMMSAREALADDTGTLFLGSRQNTVGLTPGTTDFGNAIHQDFEQVLIEQTKTVGGDWEMRTRPGQRGVDATYVGPRSRYPGYDYAELKPVEYSNTQLGEQIGKWNLPQGRTSIWWYNNNGVIGQTRGSW